MSSEPQASTAAGPARGQNSSFGLTQGAAAVNELYAFFHREGVAYTYNGKTVLRCYCKACLHHEAGLVRQERQQYGQGTNASSDLLQSIALGRIEYFIPNKAILRDHLKRGCPHLSGENRKRFNVINRLLVDQSSRSSRNRNRNQYDYGSVYEVVNSPKIPRNDQDLQPGTASPARIFELHEANLLEVAKRRRVSRSRRQRANPGGSTSASEGEDRLLGSEGADEESEPESFHEGQIVPGENDGDSHVTEADLSALNTNLLYFPEEQPEGQEPPGNFPSSDLLKSIQQYAGQLYESRGLMSTEVHPKTESGVAIPSMIQAMDASALIALGILAEELTRAQVLGPYEPQPMGDFYERRLFRTENTSTVYGLRNRRHGKVVQRMLDALPEGSTVSLANPALGRVDVDERSDVKLHSSL